MAVNKLITAYNDAAFTITATATPDTKVTVKQGKYTPPSTFGYYTTQNNRHILTQNDNNLIAQGV